jgi:hypothetical protein
MGDSVSKERHESGASWWSSAADTNWGSGVYDRDAARAMTSLANRQLGARVYEAGEVIHTACLQLSPRKERSRVSLVEVEISFVRKASGHEILNSS